MIKYKKRPLRITTNATKNMDINVKENQLKNLYKNIKSI